MNASSLCPCGSKLPLSDCCQPVVSSARKAATAEALLRARYTAFTQGNVDFILETHHSRTRGEVKREEIEDWAKSSEWLGLHVQQVEKGGAKDDHGAIVFNAKYRADGKDNDHWEYSIFEKENGDWRFVDAHAVKQAPMRRTEPKVGRNDPCPCGSGQKHKKCCGK